MGSRRRGITKNRYNNNSRDLFRDRNGSRIIIVIRRVCSNSSNNNDNRSDSYYNENRDGQCTDNKDVFLTPEKTCGNVCIIPNHLIDLF